MSCRRKSAVFASSSDIAVMLASRRDFPRQMPQISIDSAPSSATTGRDDDQEAMMMMTRPLLHGQTIHRRAAQLLARTIAGALVAVGAFVGHQVRAEPFVLRVGHFPNITHVQALVARQFEREGKSWLGERLGSNVKIEWYAYNAGPSAMEAMFANSIDLTYVGPSPALNAYVRSNGAEVRVVAGAVDGGSALVVQGDSPLRQPADFRGKKIGTPQFGNTQDVATRAWLTQGGLRITQTGGDVQ